MCKSFVYPKASTSSEYVTKSRKLWNLIFQVRKSMKINIERLRNICNSRLLSLFHCSSFISSFLVSSLNSFLVLPSFFPSLFATFLSSFHIPFFFLPLFPYLWVFFLSFLLQEVTSLLVFFFPSLSLSVFCHSLLPSSFWFFFFQVPVKSSVNSPFETRRENSALC